jgi:hypothetical protein
MVIDINEKIARNADCPVKRHEAVKESIRTGKPVDYVVGHYKYTIDAAINQYAPINTPAPSGSEGA